MLAGPVFIAVWAGQAFTRSGFDPTRHPASLLALGDQGWVQVTNFVITGALFVACASVCGSFSSRAGPAPGGRS